MKNKKPENNKLPQNKKPTKKPVVKNKKIVKVENKNIDIKKTTVDNKKAVIKQLEEKLSIVNFNNKSKFIDNILIVLIGLQAIALVYLLTR